MIGNSVGVSRTFTSEQEALVKVQLTPYERQSFLDKIAVYCVSICPHSTQEVHLWNCRIAVCCGMYSWASMVCSSERSQATCKCTCILCVHTSDT